MKRMCVLTCVLLLAVTAFGQESDVTTETETTTTVPGVPDLVRELWFVDDARPVETGQVDLRFTFKWETADAPANLGDSDDDFIVQPGIAWGVWENVELFADVPVWVGDSGDRGPFERGNADTTIGFTWRMTEPVDIWPAMAMRASARVPTGDNSNKVDGELRLIFTNEYESGIRSHINAFAKSVNGNNDDSLRFAPGRRGMRSWDGWDGGVDARHFQWGVVLGMDGPLCADGAVRWVLDYMNRSSFHYGASNLNMLELGWEWDMSDMQKLGFSAQIGLDGDDETPNFGAALSYAHSLTF